MIYAPKASAEFQIRFEEQLTALAQDVQRLLGDNLVALVLGGGYGRGEGGVVTIEGRQMPYNDIDLTLIVNEPSGVNQPALDAIGHTASKSMGIEVDFSRPLAPCDVQNWPNNLMWHDLLNGHIVLSGEPDILKRLAPPELSRPISSTEALRLLLNRGSGLLWARSVVNGCVDAPDRDFVRRNAYKCLLALGDALLITKNKYTTEYTGRDRILKELCASDSSVQALNIEDRYSDALTFKFTPDLAPHIIASVGTLRSITDSWIKVFLYTENTRYRGKLFGTIEEYIKWPGIREPEQNLPGRWLRNAAQNATLRRLSIQYPRELLYRTLAELLNEGEADCVDWGSRVDHYLRIWKRFN
jgi:hypothetical protein